MGALLAPVAIAPVQIPVPQKAPVQFLDCDNCGETIEEGSECVQLFLGRAGRGKKSGLPSVVESQYTETSSANLHVWCIAEYAAICIYEDQYFDGEEEPRFCSACDAKLDGE